MKFLDYINKLTAHGRCCFTLDEAQEILNKSRNSIVQSIEHLKTKGELASPARGFYTIVTPEYRNYGCLPAQLFIPDLMQYWQLPYYVGLLSAAMYHGAAHQQPQVFQVMIPKNRPGIQCGEVRVTFIAKKQIEAIPTQIISTEKSRLRISTPEVTAMDLLLYPLASGGLNHIITVIDELQEVMQANELKGLLAMQGGVHWKQRLGYLLEQVQAVKLTSVIDKHLKQLKRVEYIPLMTGPKKFATINKNDVWKIDVNVQLESDL